MVEMPRDTTRFPTDDERDDWNDAAKIGMTAWRDDMITTTEARKSLNEAREDPESPPDFRRVSELFSRRYFAQHVTIHHHGRECIDTLEVEFDRPAAAQTCYTDLLRTFPRHSVDCYGGRDPRVEVSLPTRQFRPLLAEFVGVRTTDTSDDEEDSDLDAATIKSFRLGGTEFTPPEIEFTDGRFVVKKPGEDDDEDDESEGTAKGSAKDAKLIVRGDSEDDDETVCPECDSPNTTGFSTGDRVCKECNHNWDP